VFASPAKAWRATTLITKGNTMIDQGNQDYEGKVWARFHLAQKAIAALISELLGTPITGSPTTNNPPTSTTNTLASEKQCKYCYWLIKSNDVPQQLVNDILHPYGVSVFNDLPRNKVPDFIKSLEALAKKVNPHFPIPRFLSNGADNPEWLAIDSMEDTPDNS
jgi:hypothetical protein